MLNQATRDTIKSTVSVLEVHGEKITTRFYERLFDSHPELKNIFNQTNQSKGRQQTALAKAVYAAAVHIDNLDNILPTVQQIAEKHRGLGVRAEHYPVVGENLLGAIQDVLGDAATPAILDAWTQAYNAIAQVFIDVEQKMYRKAKDQPGGWDGYRAFIVQKKVKESSVITSFYLAPQDGGTLAQFRPGQYLTLKLDIPGSPYTQRRQYSLSSTPGLPYYRISVKREDSRGDLPAGVVSSYLHDSIHEGDVLFVSAPAGDFVIDLETQNPVVLLSGGVGLTPLLSMLETMLDKRPNLPITYVHAALNGDVHAFKSHLASLVKTPTTLEYHVVYERPTDEDKKLPHFSKQGWIDLEFLQRHTHQHADFYVCGPEPFMRAVHRALKEWGVGAHQIHYEFFGPQGSLES